MITEQAAEALGHLVWSIESICFPDRRLDKNMRSELLLPAPFFTSGSLKDFVGNWEPCSPSVFGEFLRVDDHLIEDLSARHALRVFLRSTFNPYVAGAGKAIVMWDEPHDGIVFFHKDIDIEHMLGHTVPFTSSVSVQQRAGTEVDKPEGRSSASAATDS